jgi:hypothetical protein
LQIKPLNALYAVVWFAVFAYAAWLVYSGALFEGDPKHLHIVAIGVAWVVEYLGKLLTALIILLAGLGIAARVLFSKTSD